MTELQEKGGKGRDGALLQSSRGEQGTGKIQDWGCRDTPDPFLACFSSYPACPTQTRSQTCPGVFSTKVPMSADPRNLVPHTHTNVTGLLPGTKASLKPNDHVCTAPQQALALLLCREPPQWMHLRHDCSAGWIKWSKIIQISEISFQKVKLSEAIANMTLNEAHRQLLRPQNIRCPVPSTATTNT